jgi:hypothetical protein
MMTTHARWEWRAFGQGFGAAEGRILAVAGEERRTEEIYLISPWSDLNVKIRDGHLDVKSLVRTNASGLEQWQPVLKEKFPIGASTVAALLVDWHMEPTPIASDRKFSQIRLLSLLGDVAPEIAIIPVAKRRRTGELSGCVIEIGWLEAEGQLMETLAIESEDATRVTALLEMLGLDALDNVNSVSELRRVHAMTPGFMPIESSVGRTL